VASAAVVGARVAAAVQAGLGQQTVAQAGAPPPPHHHQQTTITTTTANASRILTVDLSVLRCIAGNRLAAGDTL